MKYILSILFINIIFAVSCSSQILLEQQTATDSSSVLSNICKPYGLNGISFLNGRIATLSYTRDASHMTVLEADGAIVCSADLQGNTVSCKLIADGTKVLLNGIIAENHQFAQVFDISKCRVTVNFKCPFYVSSSPNARFFYSIYDVAVENRPIIYDSSGNIIGNVKSPFSARYSAWNMSALDDSTIIFTDGSFVNIIGVPDLLVREQYMFSEVSRAYFIIGLANSPDGSVFAVYNTDSIVIFDRVNKTKSVFPNPRPDVWGVKSIIFTDEGEYALTLFHSPDRNRPCYNLHKKFPNGYMEMSDFAPFPEGINITSFHYQKGRSIFVYDFVKHDDNHNPDFRFKTAVFQLPQTDSSRGYLVKMNGFSYPGSQKDLDINNIIFNSANGAAAILEFIHVVRAN
ncbi:MAG: hypothetical protein AB1746_03860 [Candidatus Zixiibacteriota bacterium]